MLEKVKRAIRSFCSSPLSFQFPGLGTRSFALHAFALHSFALVALYGSKSLLLLLIKKRRERVTLFEKSDKSEMLLSLFNKYRATRAKVQIPNPGKLK